MRKLMVLLALALLMSATPPARVNAAPSPVETVRAFYEALGDGQYKDAYALLSTDFQRAHPSDAWRAGYSNMIGLRIVSIAPGQAPDAVDVIIFFANARTQQVVRNGAQVGTWLLVIESDAWRLDREMITV